MKAWSAIGQIQYPWATVHHDLVGKSFWLMFQDGTIVDDSLRVVDSIGEG